MLSSRFYGVIRHLHRFLIAVFLGIWCATIYETSNKYALASSIWPIGDEFNLCQRTADEKSDLCVIDIQRFQNGAETTVRLHLYEGKIGMPPRNEYFVWTSCEDEEYRILSREPVHLPAPQRLQTIQAVSDSHLHRTLRLFGSYACETKT